MALALRTGRAAGPALQARAAGNALLVHPKGEPDPHAVRFAGSLAPDESHQVVVVDLPYGTPESAWEAVARLLAPRPGSLRLVIGRTTPQEARRAGQLLADRLDRLVLAPDGEVLPTAGGGLFIPADHGAGWLRFRRGREPERDSQRFPKPLWEFSTLDRPWETSPYGVVESVPSGVWVRSARPRELLAGWRRLIDRLPSDPRVLTVVLGCPGGPAVPLGDVVEVWESILPSARSRTRFVHFGPVALPEGGALGQALADAVGEHVTLWTGIPLGAGRLEEEVPGWEPFVQELLYAPGSEAPPALLGMRPPLPGARQIGTGLYEYTADAVLEVVQCGLWMRPVVEPADGQEVRRTPAAPGWSALLYDRSTPEIAERMHALAQDMLWRLEPAGRAVFRVAPADDPAAAAPPGAEDAWSLPEPSSEPLVTAPGAGPRRPAHVALWASPEEASAPAAPPEPRTRRHRPAMGHLSPDEAAPAPAEAVAGASAPPAVLAAAPPSLPTVPETPSPADSPRPETEASFAAPPGSRQPSEAASAAAQAGPEWAPHPAAPGSRAPESPDLTVPREPTAPPPGDDAAAPRLAPHGSGQPWADVAAPPGPEPGAPGPAPLGASAQTPPASPQPVPEGPQPLASATVTGVESDTHVPGADLPPAPVGETHTPGPAVPGGSPEAGVPWPDPALPDIAPAAGPSLPPPAVPSPPPGPEASAAPPPAPAPRAPIAGIRLESGPADGPSLPVPAASPAPQPPGTAEAAEPGVRVQPAPKAGACAVPPERGIDQEREWVRRTFSAQYNAVAGTVSRVMSESPGLRGASRGAAAEALTDLVAVRLYLSGDSAEVDAAVRGATVGPHVPLARCIASGLRRLPSYRGAALLRARLGAAERAWYREGRLVTEWAFCTAYADPYPATGNADFLVWSVTGRRTALLDPAAPGRVVFLPGTVFKVLRTEDGGRPLLLLRELAPAEAAQEPGGAARVPLDDIALEGLERAAELLRADGGDAPGSSDGAGPGPGAPPGLLTATSDGRAHKGAKP